MNTKFLLAMTLSAAVLAGQSARAAVFVASPDLITCPGASSTSTGALVESLKFTFSNSNPPFNATDTRTDNTTDYARSYPPFDSANTADPTRGFPALYTPNPNVGDGVNDYLVKLCIVNATPSIWNLNIKAPDFLQAGLDLNRVQARARVALFNGLTTGNAFPTTWQSLATADTTLISENTTGIYLVEIQYRLSLDGNELSNLNPYASTINYTLQ